MPPPSSSTSPSTGPVSPEEQFRVVRKRNRVPLSCYPCRAKKKCDRSHPCSNCVKRDGPGASSCSYASPSSRKKNQNQAQPTPDDMQIRINRLENLVLSLMHNGAGTIDPDTAASASRIVAGVSADGRGGAAAGAHDGDDDTDSDIDDGLATSLGVLKVDADRGKSMYIGQEHWHTILADLAEVKSYFVQNHKDLEKTYERVLRSKPAVARETPTFLLGVEPTTEGDLRAELPPKSTVLTLCARYFNSMDNAVNIIHTPTFHAQLRKHWQNPSQTPLMWLGLLYAIMCLAMLSFHKVGDEPPEWKGHAMDLASLFRVRTVQCLITSDYTRPTEYTVETMILYIFSEHSSRWNADMGLWLIGGVIARTALRMGYHRDAKWFPSITPFQGEMRRRSWALVRMCDVMFSHQVSLPNMLYDHDCDTQMPRNIFDEEFGPDSTELPPSRPSSEPTPISYMIVKVQLCTLLGRILQATTRVGKQAVYDDILRFDKELLAIRADLPDHLRIKPLEGSPDPLTLIIARFNLDILYQKIVCLLHRKYMDRARQNGRYAYSRRRAVEASLETLRYLDTLNKESQPNGRLRSVNWYVVAIATKDFLLPAMIVALEVRFVRLGLKEGQDRSVADLWNPAQIQEMVRLLEKTREVWRPLSETSLESYKAYNVLNVVLQRITSPSADAPAAAVGAPAELRRSDLLPDGASSAGKPFCVDTPASEAPAAPSGPVAATASASTMPAALQMTSLLPELGQGPDGLGLGPMTGAAGGAAAAAAATMTTPPMGLFGTSAAEAPAGAAYESLLNPVATAPGSGSGGGGAEGATETTPPSMYSADLYGGLADFTMANGVNASNSLNFLDENMDFSTNFDWDTLQTYTQNGAFNATEQFFPGSTEVFDPFPLSGDALGGGGNGLFAATAHSTDPSTSDPSTGPSTGSTGPPTDPSTGPST